MNTTFAVTDACAGCGACIKTCPEKAIRPAPKDHASPLIVLADRCSGCAECAEVCPVSACVEVASLHENREAPAPRVESRENPWRRYPRFSIPDSRFSGRSVSDDQ